MAAVLILAGLALSCLAIFSWMWLCSGVLREGLRGQVARAALQISGLCLVYGMLRGELLGAVFLAGFPPLVLADLLRAGPFLAFLTDLAWRVLPVAAVALAVTLGVRGLRRWSLGLTGGAALLASVFLGDQLAEAAMCKAAAARGFDSFALNSFGWSLANVPQEFQFELHALAAVEERRLGWSYRLQDWYPIPPNASADVAAPVQSCL